MGTEGSQRSIEKKKYITQSLQRGERRNVSRKGAKLAKVREKKYLTQRKRLNK